MEHADEPSNASSFYRRTLGGLTGRAVVFVLLICLQLGVILPLAPRMVEDYLANHDAGFDVNCGSYTAHDRPDVCKRASSKASVIQITCDSLKCLLAFLFAPLIGTRSDMYGRMPYIVPLSALIGLPTVSLLLCDLGIFGLLPYFVTTAISPLYILLSLSTSYAADALLPDDRAAGFGLILGGFGIGLSVSPCMAMFLSRRVMLYFGAITALACPAWALLGMPESLRQQDRVVVAAEDTVAPGNSEKWMSRCAALNPFAPLRILGKSPIFKTLAMAIFTIAVITDGCTNLDSYYVTDVFGLSTHQLAASLMLVGVGTMVCQILLLKHAVRILGERYVLILACGCVIVSKFGYFIVGLLRPQWQWFVFMQYTLFAPLVLWAFPAASAMKANVVPETMQGAVQGALFGVRCLAQGLCPPIFAVIYGMLNGHSFPDHPATTYLCLTVAAFGSLACALAIPKDWRTYRVSRDSACDESTVESVSADAASADTADAPLIVSKPVDNAPPSDSGENGRYEPPPALPGSPTRLKRGASLFANI
eukprot:g1531.t1